MRITALKQVQDKYNFDRIQYPVPYDSISAVEEQNQVCMHVYEINESNNKIDESKKGNYDYITNEIIICCGMKKMTRAITSI